MSGISGKDNAEIFHHSQVTDTSLSVYEFMCQRLTEPGSLKLFPLSLDGLFDDSLSGTMKTTLTTFDPVHQLNLLQFRAEPLQVPAHKEWNTELKCMMQKNYQKVTQMNIFRFKL